MGRLIEEICHAPEAQMWMGGEGKQKFKCKCGPDWFAFLPLYTYQIDRWAATACGPCCRSDVRVWVLVWPVSQSVTCGDVGENVWRKLPAPFFLNLGSAWHGTRQTSLVWPGLVLRRCTM